MRRSRVVIISEILSEAKGGVGKTALVYHTNLNFKLIDKYLESLIKENLVKVENGSRLRYKTTEKGFDFLKIFNVLKIPGDGHAVDATERCVGRGTRDH